MRRGNQLELAALARAKTLLLVLEDVVAGPLFLVLDLFAGRYVGDVLPDRGLDGTSDDFLAAHVVEVHGPVAPRMGGRDHGDTALPNANAELTARYSGSFTIRTSPTLVTSGAGDFSGTLATSSTFPSSRTV